MSLAVELLVSSYSMEMINEVSLHSMYVTFLTMAMDNRHQWHREQVTGHIVPLGSQHQMDHF